MEITTHIPPLPGSLITELADFWLKAFGEPYEDQAGIRGQELEYNHDFFYVTRREGKVVGTARLIVPREIPTLGGLGEVATDPDSRRLGIGSAMSAKAGEDFKSMGGKAWFLGTINPNAMRVYSRLGWKRLAWSIAWAQIIGDESPEEFLIDYFRTETGESSVRPGSPLERVTMVPLFATPHDWQILDSNTEIFSTRYSMLRGALLLYPRFEKMCVDNKGTWFASYTNTGKLTGISTARLDKAGNCKIDAVAHSRFMSVWPELVQSAIEWASSKSAENCYAMLSQEDEEKQNCFEEIGFHIKGTGPDFQLGDRSVPAVKMVI